MSFYVGDCLVCRFGWSSVQTYIPDSHLHRMTYTRYHIDTTESPDDEHLNAQNMQRIEKKHTQKELCVKLVIKQNYTELHGQQNIKYSVLLTYCFVLQIWRAATAVFYYPTGFPFLINCYFLYNYSLRLETGNTVKKTYIE